MTSSKRLFPISDPRSIGWGVAAVALALFGLRLALGPGEIRYVDRSAPTEIALPARPQPALHEAEATTPPESAATPPVAEAAQGEQPPTLRADDAGYRPAPPDLTLVEASPYGPLPKIGPDRRRPLAYYARSYDQADRRPKVAVLLQGLGLQIDATNAAMHMPGAVSLHFSAASVDLPALFDRARAAGHEVFLDLPMEPGNYPGQGPSPQTLLADASADTNFDRLTQLLARAPGYVGLAGAGRRFAESPAATPVLKVLAERGLGLVEIGSAGLGEAAAAVQLPYAATTVVIDRDPSRAAIDQALATLEATAKAEGTALGVAEAYPISLQRIADWLNTFDQKGLALAPVSALLLARGGVDGAVGRRRPPDFAQSQN